MLYEFDTQTFKPSPRHEILFLKRFVCKKMIIMLKIYSCFLPKVLSFLVQNALFFLVLSVLQPVCCKFKGQKQGSPFQNDILEAEV